MEQRWSEAGEHEQLHIEHFQPSTTVGEGQRGTGGTIRFRKSELEACSDGEQPILVAGEKAGANLPYRVSHGNLPYLRGEAAVRAGARSAHRARARSARGDVAHLHQRARGRGRDRPLTDRRHDLPKEPACQRSTPRSHSIPPNIPTPASTGAQRPPRQESTPTEREAQHLHNRERAPAPALGSRSREPESPLARLTPEQTGAAGPRVRRDPRRGVRRPGRSRLALHTLHDQAAPPAGAGGARDADSARATSRCGWRAPPRCRSRRSSRTWRSATT